MVDAIVPARALPQSKLNAVVSLQSYGVSGSKARLSVRNDGKILTSQEITLKGDGQIQSETLVFNCGDAGPKTLEIGVEPLSGEENTRNNTLSRLVNVESRTPRILYFEGEPRWEYKFIRRALDDFPNVELASMLRTTENKLYRQGFHNEQESGRRFSFQARGSVPVPGPDHRQRGGQLLHPHPAAVDPRFRGPARRRPALHRRPRLALRRRLSELAAGGPGAHRPSRGQGDVPPRFHRRGAYPGRRPERHHPPG